MSDKQDQPEQNVDAEEALEQAENFSFDEAAAEAEAENTATEVTAEELAKLLHDAQSKAEEHQDKLIRAHAEIDNLKRRHTQELEKAHKYALDKFVNELLGVWDSLELGNQAAQDANASVDNIREGTELTLKMLSDVMTKFGVEQVNPEGEAFNPEFHQAMSMQPRDDVPNNTVVGVVQKGYVLNGRLVRPAMVMVSQGGPAAAPQSPSIDENA